MRFTFLTFKRITWGLLGICLVTGALLILHRFTKAITFSMIVDATKATPATHIFLSTIATLVSFSAIAANEIIAVKALPNKILPLRLPILAGTIGNALSNTLGFPALTISAWRYRVYNGAGLSVMDVTRITGVALMGVVFGFLGVTSLSLLLDKSHHSAVIFPSRYVECFFGSVLLSFIFGFQIWLSRKHQKIHFNRWSISLPQSKLGIAQCLIGLIDTSAAIYAAYVLLPNDITHGLADFSIIYIGAVLLGIASHAPGGVGVFEASIVTLLAVEGRADVVAALLLYRIIYNLIPFFFACTVVALQLLRARPQLDKG